jgi:hypothetical protein
MPPTSLDSLKLRRSLRNPEHRTANANNNNTKRPSNTMYSLCDAYVAKTAITFVSAVFVRYACVLRCCLGKCPQDDFQW